VLIMAQAPHAHIDLNRVSLSIPVYGLATRSLKKVLISLGSAGRIATDALTGMMHVEALRDVTMSLPQGTRLGVMGRNGSGKSSLLRVLSGIYTPTSGRIDVAGSVIPLLDINLGIDEESTGRENILHRSIFLGLSADDFKKIEQEVIDFTELGDFIDLPVRTYSLGMRMRLAFAVSTCISPDVLLLDEWISTGDAQFIAKAETRLAAMVEQLGILVLASHDPNIVRRVCNRLVIMHQGEVLHDGSVQEGLERYAALP
jgi:ABC-2 type transport system ATP-binding protein